MLYINYLCLKTTPNPLKDHFVNHILPQRRCACVPHNLPYGAVLRNNIISDVLREMRVWELYCVVVSFYFRLFHCGMPRDKATLSFFRFRFFFSFFFGYYILFIELICPFDRLICFSNFFQGECMFLLQSSRPTACIMMPRFGAQSETCLTRPPAGARMLCLLCLLRCFCEQLFLPAVGSHFPL